MWVHSFSAYQQAISAVSDTSESGPYDNFPSWFLTIPVADSDCYELNGGCYAVYGYEYKPGFVEDKAVCTSPHAPGLCVDTILSAQYITWINDNKTAWTMNVAGTAADSRVNIGPRPVPQEPMVRLPRVPFPTKSLITFVGLRFSLYPVHHS